MKKMCSEIIEKMEGTSLSGSNLWLTVLVAFLTGIIVGMLCSVKGTRFYGCYNGATTIGAAEETDEDELEI